MNPEMAMTPSSWPKPSVVLACSPGHHERVAGRQVPAQLGDRLRDGVVDVGGQRAGDGEAEDRHHAHLVLPADLLGLHAIADAGHLPDGDLVLVLGGEDVEVAQVAELGALARLQAGHDGNLLVVLAQDGDLGAVDGRRPMTRPRPGW